jgi:RHS repeat-associated protein
MLGTTRFMTDSGGDAIEAAVHTAFGEPVTGTNHRYGYAGAWGYQAHRIDEVENLDPPPEPPLDPDEVMPFLHVGHRYYDPATGRFLQRDPIGIAGGLNVYIYPLRPTVQIDADGLVAVDYPTNTTPGADWLPQPPRPPRGSPGWKLKPKGWVPKPPRPPKLPWWRPSFRFGSPQVTAAVVTGAAGLATGCAIAHIKVRKKRIREHIGDFLLKVCPSCWNW